MYYLGDDYSAIFNICYHGLQENPNNELLKNVMSVLGEHDKKHRIEYRISGFTINGEELNLVNSNKPSKENRPTGDIYKNGRKL